MEIKQALKIILGSCFILMFFSLCSLVMAENGRTFTPKELAKYNGQNGAPAYVAVNGIVYNLTTVPEWANGRHFCEGALAGKILLFSGTLPRHPIEILRF